MRKPIYLQFIEIQKKKGDNSIEKTLHTFINFGGMVFQVYL